MSTDEKHFKDIEAKISAQKKAWPSKLNKACLDKAIKNITPILEEKLPNKSQLPKLLSKSSRTRG